MRCALMGFSSLCIVAPLLGAGPMRSNPRPTEAATIAFDGLTMVIPLAPGSDAEGASWIPAREPRVTTADGRPVESSVVYIAVQPVQPPSAAHDDSESAHASHASLPEWLPDGPAYTVMDYKTLASSRRADEMMSERGVGFWALVCLPPAGSRLDGLVINDDRHPLRITATHAFVPDREPSEWPRDSWRAVGEMLRSMASDPLQRWRVRLLEDRVGGALLWGDSPPPAPIDRPELEALARQIEEIWRAALALVAQSDRQTATDLARTLTAVSRLPTGAIAPVWPVEEGSHGPLLHSLTVEGIDSIDAARRARAYLDSLNPVRITVTDDNQGLVGVTELRGVDTTVKIADAVVRIDAFESADGLIPEQADEGGVSTTRARSGAWSADVSAVNGAPPVRPPGFRIGPTYTPWTLTEWRLGRAAPTLGDLASGALLQRAPGEPAGDRGGGAGRGHAWQVYVECSAPHSGPPAGDEVVLYFGGGRSPRIIRRVDIGGTIRDADGLKVGSFQTAFDHGMWWAIVEVPPEAVEPDGTLLIAMERRDASGWRATWPRPLLPGQERPAPVRLDLNTWDAELSR